MNTIFADECKALKKQFNHCWSGVIWGGDKNWLQLQHECKQPKNILWILVKWIYKQLRSMTDICPDFDLLV